jgi:hypothetical protein
LYRKVISHSKESKDKYRYRIRNKVHYKVGRCRKNEPTKFKMRTLFHLIKKPNKSGSFPHLVEHTSPQRDQCICFRNIDKVGATYLSANYPSSINKLLYREGPKHALESLFNSPLLILFATWRISKSPDGVGVDPILLYVV